MRRLICPATLLRPNSARLWVYRVWRTVLSSPRQLLGIKRAAAVLAGVVAATMLGIGWGYIVVLTNSIFPAMVLQYLVDVLLDAETFINPQANDDSLTPLFLGLTILWPLLTILITRVVTARQPLPVGYGS